LAVKISQELFIDRTPHPSRLFFPLFDYCSVVFADLLGQHTLKLKWLMLVCASFSTCVEISMFRNSTIPSDGYLMTEELILRVIWSFPRKKIFLLPR